MSYDPATFVDNLQSLHQKYESLAEKWGEELPVRAAVPLSVGALEINRFKDKETNTKPWRLLYRQNNGRNPLSNAPFTIQMEAIDHLPALRREMGEALERRMLDLEHAHTVMDGLIK